MRKYNSDVKISIIMVSYNAVKTIEQAIQSIVNQTYNNIEFIVIDGDSKDGTIDVIKKYEDKITYWTNEPDNGIYDAMNKGINYASGEYIYFLGADDCLITDNIIQQVIVELNDNDVLSGGVKLVDEELGLERRLDGKFAKHRANYNGMMIPHQGMFVKSKIMKKNKFNLKYKIAADYDFFLKCYFNDSIKIKYIDLPIAYYSSGGASSLNLIGNSEHTAIMIKYGIDKKVIERMESKYNSVEKGKIKNFLRKIGLMKYILLLLGAKKHSCKWKICRWCKK